jgi:hypothetical protein
MSTFLAIDSNYASDIAAASTYREDNIYPYLAKCGFTMSPFFGPLARRGFVSPAAVDPGVRFLTGVGHGTYDTFTGYGFESIFEKGSYSAEEVSGKIAHFLSCQNGMSLGPDFVTKGCLAYIGYDENFTFDPDSANVFFECDGEIDKALADGLTVGDAMNRSKALFNKRIAELGNTYPASILAFNLSHLRSPTDGTQWGSVSVSLT